MMTFTQATEGVIRRQCQNLTYRQFLTDETYPYPYPRSQFQPHDIK